MSFDVNKVENNNQQSDQYNHKYSK